MSHNRIKMKGSISLAAMSALITFVIAGSYFYIDYQADSKASQAMVSIVDNARTQGVALSYRTVDASPITQSVEIIDLAITGHEQEPDIHLGSVVLKGLSWQDLNNQTNDLPTEMSIDIKQGEFIIKKSIINDDSDLQSLVDIFGDTLSFSSYVAYKFDFKNSLLHVTLNQSVDDSFVFDAKITLGDIAWLSDLKTDQTQQANDLMYKAIESTLNNLSLSYKNLGFIEKVRAVAIKKTGKTNEQLAEQSITQLEQLKVISANNWGPLFTPLIDEMIKFTREPRTLKLDINPQRPLTGQDFMMAFMGGESGLIQLLENAQINLKAN